MNIVDLVVIVLLVLSAVHGLRLGAIVQILSYGGFLVGLFVAALLASVTVRYVHGVDARTLVSLGTMLGVAIFFATLGRVVGTVAFHRVHRGVLGPVDSGLGMVVAVVAALLAVWLVASTLVNSSSLRSTRRSPSPASSGPSTTCSRHRPRSSSGCRPSSRQEGFPPVFAQLAPASAGPVPLPGNASCSRRSPGRSRRRSRSSGSGVARSKKDPVSSSPPAWW